MSDGMCDECGASVASNGKVKHKEWHARTRFELEQLQRARAACDEEFAQMDKWVQRMTTRVTDERG